MLWEKAALLAQWHRKTMIEFSISPSHTHTTQKSLGKQFKLLDFSSVSLFLKEYVL